MEPPYQAGENKRKPGKLIKPALRISQTEKPEREVLGGKGGTAKRIIETNEPGSGCEPPAP